MAKIRFSEAASYILGLAMISVTIVIPTVGNYFVDKRKNTENQRMQTYLDNIVNDSSAILHSNNSSNLANKLNTNIFSHTYSLISSQDNVITRDN